MKTQVYCDFSTINPWTLIESFTLEKSGLYKGSSFEMDDPKGISKERTWTWKSGTVGAMYMMSFDDKSDIDYFSFLIKQKHKSLSQRGG